MCYIHARRPGIEAIYRHTASPCMECDLLAYMQVDLLDYMYSDCLRFDFSFTTASRQLYSIYSYTAIKLCTPILVIGQKGKLKADCLWHQKLNMPFLSARKTAAGGAFLRPAFIISVGA